MPDLRTVSAAGFAGCPAPRFCNGQMGRVAQPGAFDIMAGGNPVTLKTGVLNLTL